jgi:NADH:ubiquinone oxidoreductase subunit B-like Fe-S oxidoreductase
VSSTFSSVRRWARRRSIHLLPFGTTCCAAELDAALGPTFDPPHQGIAVVDDPAIADLLVVAGRLARPVADQLCALYEQMPRPATVIAFGSCALTGGAWSEHGVTVELSSIVDVELTIPGCAPPPQHLYQAIAQLRHDQ